VRIKETNASGPLKTCRKSLTDVRTRSVSSFWEPVGREPEDCPAGVQHKGGVSLIRAFMRNGRACRPDVTGEGQAGGPGKAESTEAGHRVGAAHRRAEGPLMGSDRRGCVVQRDDGADQRWAERCGPLPRREPRLPGVRLPSPAQSARGLAGPLHAQAQEADGVAADAQGCVPAPPIATGCVNLLNRCCAVG